MNTQLPIINPSVPFLGYIPGGLNAGRMVIIQGQVQPLAKRFTVALLCAAGDVALQLNTRFAMGPVLGCTAQCQWVWVPEELCEPPPLTPGGTLEIIINTQEHDYQVSVNGQHMLVFPHRLPLPTVQALQVTGDVTLTCITFTGPVRTPSSMNCGQAAAGLGVPALTPSGTPPPVPMTVSSPAVPSKTALSKGPSGLIQPITIVGTVPNKANRFAINLQSSISGDVALHFNPRPREAVLVRNTQQSGCWGPEERDLRGPMPFLRGQPFLLEIQTLSQAFSVWVNGCHICDYRHRLPPSTIDQLEVSGDVILACVKY